MLVLLDPLLLPRLLRKSCFFIWFSPPVDGSGGLTPTLFPRLPPGLVSRLAFAFNGGVVDAPTSPPLVTNGCIPDSVAAYKPAALSPLAVASCTAELQCAAASSYFLDLRRH